MPDHAGKPHLALRATRVVAGALLVLVGVVALALPGPFTIPPVLAGLHLLSYDVPAAARLRDRLVAAVRARARRDKSKDSGKDTEDRALERDA